MKHQWEARPIWGKIWWHRRVGNNCWRGVPEYLRRHRSGCTWASRAWARNKGSLPTVRGGKMSVGTDACAGPCAAERGRQFFLIASTLSVERTQPRVRQREEVLKEGLHRGDSAKASRGTGEESARKRATTANQHQGPTWGTHGQELYVSPVSKPGWFCSSLCYPMGVDMRSAESWIQQTWGFAKWMGQTEKTKGIGGICKEETAARPHVI